MSCNEVLGLLDLTIFSIEFFTEEDEEVKYGHFFFAIETIPGQI